MPDLLPPDLRKRLNALHLVAPAEAAGDVTRAVEAHVKRLAVAVAFLVGNDVINGADYPEDVIDWCRALVDDDWDEEWYPVDAVRAAIAGTAAGPTRDEILLRRLLAFRVTSPALLYTDDGELSDASARPLIDFLRDSPQEIQAKLIERNHGREGILSEEA